MRLLSYMVFVMFLTACQSTPTETESNQNRDNDEAKEFASLILTEKLKQNGPSLLCGQPNYNACYGLSESECRGELSRFHEKCIDTTAKKLGPLIVGKNEGEYGRQYTMCMSMNHMIVHSERIKEIASCLKGMQYDEQAAVKSLLQ